MNAFLGVHVREAPPLSDTTVSAYHDGARGALGLAAVRCPAEDECGLHAGPVESPKPGMLSKLLGW